MAITSLTKSLRRMCTSAFFILHIGLESVFAQAGFFGTGGGLITLSQNNGSSETTYNMDGRDLGETYSLILDGGIIHTWKGANGNICGGNVYYRVYKNSTTPGSFSSLSLGFSSNNPFTTASTPSNVSGNNGGDQRWQVSGQNIDLLSGLSDYGATYTLEIYFDASGSSSSSSGCSETFYYSNSGNNFKLSFVLRRSTVSDGNWSDGSIWQGAVVPDIGEKLFVLHNVDINTHISNTGGIDISSGKKLNVLSGDTLTIGSGITGLGQLDVNGSFVINSGGFTLIEPSFKNGSFLIYASGGAYNRGNEWNTGNPYHLVISGGTSLNLGFGAASAHRSVLGDITITAGSKLDLNSPSMSSVFVVLGDISNEGTMELSSSFGADLEVGGDFHNLGTFIANTRQVTFNGISGQELTGNWTGTTNNHFDYLRILNSSGSGVALLTDVRVQSRLFLDSGVIYLRTNHLLIDAGADIDGNFGLYNMLVTDSSGLLKRGINSTGTYLLPVGKSHYSPVELVVNSGTLAGIEVGVNDSKYRGNRSLSNFIRRYWVLEGIGISNLDADLTLHYQTADVNGIEDSLYGGRNINDSIWFRYSRTNSANSSLHFNGLNDFGIFTAGERDSMTSFYPAKIIVQPKSLQSCEGYPGALNIQKTGTVDSVIWQRNKNGTWQILGGVHADTIHFDSLTTEQIGDYRAIAYALAGNDTSQIAAIQIGARPQMNILGTPAGANHSGALNVQLNNEMLRYARWSSQEGLSYPSGNELNLSNLSSGTYYLMCVTTENCLFYFGPFGL